MRDSPFPDISEHLLPDSNCVQAAELFKTRNIAQVMLDIYNIIPANLPELCNDYRRQVGHWMVNTIPYRAPEVFGMCWYDAGNLLSKIFKNYEGEPFVEQIKDIFNYKSKA